MGVCNFSTSDMYCIVVVCTRCCACHDNSLLASPNEEQCDCVSSLYKWAVWPKAAVKRGWDAHVGPAAVCADCAWWAVWRMFAECVSPTAPSVCVPFVCCSWCTFDSAWSVRVAHNTPADVCGYKWVAYPWLRWQLCIPDLVIFSLLLIQFAYFLILCLGSTLCVGWLY